MKKKNKEPTNPTWVHLKKTGTRIYRRKERGGRDPPGTTPMTDKQFKLLL